MRIPEFKKEYNKKCEHELDELFDIDDKEFYDVILDHYQQMPRCENEVQNFLNNYEILKVQSPMATKKSNVIEEVLKQAKKQNKKCLFITNRRSLANDISEKYKISNYQNPYFYNDHLVSQFDSLYKFNVRKFDVVIIDEISSLLHYMNTKYEGKEKNHIKNTYRLLYLMKNKQVALFDAFIIWYPYMERKTLGILNRFRENRNVYIANDNEYFEYCITHDDKKFTISSNEKRFLNKISESLIKLNKNKKILLHTADTNNRDEIIEAFKKNSTKYDIILYSPTITVGLSNEAKFDNHYHYDVGGTIGVIDSLQMMRRTRNVQNIYVYLKGRKSYLNTDINYIENRLTEYSTLDELGEEDKINEQGKMLAKIIQMYNILENSHKYAFKRLLAYQFNKNFIINGV